MKEGWKISKLGDIGTFQRGGGFLKRDFVENGYPCIHYGQIHTTLGVSTSKHITCIPKELALSKSKIAHPGDIILAITSEDIEGSCKCTAWTGEYDIAIGSHAAIFHHLQNPKFLSYYFRGKSFSRAKQRFVHGIKVMEIKPNDIATIEINYPSIPEQEHIVAELDLLSDIIEKKKAQLKELDNLAQSIFYDMFGDPIANEKGKDLKKLRDICKTTSGGTPSKTHPEYYQGGNIPWLRSGEVSKMFITETELFITEAGMNNSSSKLFPENTVAVAMYGATAGQVGIIKKAMTTNQAVCGILPNPHLLPLYLYHFLLSKKEELVKQATGGAQPNISQGVIKDIMVYCPPLDLQHSFATRIEAIEKQKSTIQKSIEDAQALFDSRMDYYFN